MPDIQEKEFDYSLVDKETAKFLQEKEDNIKRSVGRAAYEIGKELKEAKEKLGDDYSQKIFKKWCKSLGISRSTGDEYIRYYKGFRRSNLDENHLKKLPRTVVQALGSNRTPEQIKNKIENKEITKETEMKKLRKKLNQERKQKEKLQEQIEKIKNQEPETQIKEIEKEVIPDDYNDVKEKAERLEKAKEFMQEQVDELEERLRQTKQEKQQTEQEVKEFKNLQAEVNRLRKRKDDIGKQVDSAANISKWAMDIKKVLKNDLAPMKYNEDITNQAHDSIVMDNVLEVVELVEDWCNDMRNMINETQNTINVEVINNE